MKQWENANMVRTVYTVMKLWICVVFFICISMITLVAALDLCRNENDLKIPSYYNARQISFIYHIIPNSYSYFFFSFPFLNQIADFVSNSEFMVPDCHIDAINQAFDKHNSHVYFFVSAQNSKIIHVLIIEYLIMQGLCEMRERACRDQEVSHRFQVKWLKVIHMPFMIFDQEGFIL